jgi:hypothetical protein
MPNAGKKKHYQPKKERVSAKDFAIPYSVNVGDLDKSIKFATQYESTAKAEVSRAIDETAKDWNRTLGFWNNVKNILLKYKKELSK